MIRRLLAACAVTLAVGFLQPVNAQEMTLKFGHAASSKHLFQDGVQMFADAVAEKTGGKVKIEVYGDRQLGDDKQLLEGLKLGTIDGALVSAPVLPLVIGASSFDALQLPFLVGSYEQMADLLSSGIGQKLLDSLDEQGLKGLGYIEAGQRHFLARNKQVETIDDFKDLKTRIVPTPLHKAIWEAVGTNPTGLAYGEIYSALETGTIDAVEINLSSILSESLFQAGKHVTLTGHYFWPGVLMMGSKFKDLPEDVQAAMVEAGHEVIAKHYALAASQEADTKTKLEAEGVTITPLADLEAMRKLTQTVVDAWIPKGPLIGEFVKAAHGM